MVKRLVDIVVASRRSWPCSPVFAGPSPVLIPPLRRPRAHPAARQERVGLSGRRFRMLKFRTMRTDAEDVGPAGLATADDPRRTRAGRRAAAAVPRRAAAAVERVHRRHEPGGPAARAAGVRRAVPERIPALHAAPPASRAGITGWAQVNGWRGNTSLDQRIEYDLYYIEQLVARASTSRSSSSPCSAASARNMRTNEQRTTSHGPHGAVRSTSLAPVSLAARR